MDRFPKLSSEEMLVIVQNGLKKTKRRKKVIVIGAGMAGLVSSSLLKEAGHDVHLIEASDRVGGRVYTIRSPFTDGFYLDAGAMRIPNIHHLTLAYIKKFKLQTNSFINSTPSDLMFVNNIKTRLSNYEQNPDILRYPVAHHEKGKTALQLLNYAIKPILDFIEKDPLNNWKIVIKSYNQYSMDLFLRYNPFGRSLSSGAIEMIKVLLSTEGFPELSFLEIVRDLIILTSPTIHFSELTGGNDHLPKAFIPQLTERIYYTQEVTKIVQDNDQVTVHTIQSKTLKTFKMTADLAIITIPFSILQFVDIEPHHSISEEKWRAIRELHYVPSTKVGIQFSKRFWEDEGLKGGQMITDLPIRFTYYPSSGIGTSSPGVLLGSYTWEDDALIWASQNENSIIRKVLKNLATVHGKQVYRYFLTGTAHSWSKYRYSGGAFTMFKPQQETDIGPYISTPEENLHFAGEHTSTAHGWIEGAVESGIRAAYEINERL